MVKSKEQLMKKSKDRRKRLLEGNKQLKQRKNWYSVSDRKTHFVRKVKQQKEVPMRKDIEAGQILILLSGRFRGRRVVFLKKLENGLLLVTGPYKYNGVPLKRVNQAYVIATKTKVDIKGINLDAVKKDFFKRVVIKRDTEKDFFEEPQQKKDRITEERRVAQANIDTQVKKAVDAIPMLNAYLKNRFALKNGDKPHLMKF